jgi:hypothetical protein
MKTPIAITNALKATQEIVLTDVTLMDKPMLRVLLILTGAALVLGMVLPIYFPGQ